MNNYPQHTQMTLKKSIFMLGLILLMLRLQGQDKGFILHYDKPAKPDSETEANQRGRGNEGYMGEALLLGNGRLGAAFGGGIDRERIVLNEISAWANTSRGRDEVTQSGVRIGSYKHLEEVREAVRNEQFGIGRNSAEALATKHLGSHMRLGNYTSFTDVFISTGHDASQVENYKRSLNLRTGMGTVSYNIGDTKYTREYFCSYPNDLLVVRYTSDGEVLNLKINSTTQHITKIKHGYVNRSTLVGEIPMIRDNMKFMQVIHVVSDETKNGVRATVDGDINVRNAKDVTIYIAGYTDYLPVYPEFKGRDYEVDCEKTTSIAESAGFEALKKAHIADVSALIDRCRFEPVYESSGLSTDQLVEKGKSVELETLYFNFARYLQTACSRGTAIPSNLQGIWNKSVTPAWNCDYHNDINIAMNYWMVETANLPECFDPYTGWMKIIAESGSHTAREAYGAERGWSTGLNGNVFGFTAPNEHGRRMQHSGAWLAQNLYDHFSFSRDHEYLREIYPIVKGAAEFYLEFLAPWKDGTLVAYPTWSPENAFLADQYTDLNKVYWGASYDQQLIYNLFVDCIEASVLLGIDEEFRAELNSTIPKLCPQKIGRFGQIQEWPEDMDRFGDTHRHVSHLIALHPGRDISLLTNHELAEAFKLTLDHRCGGVSDEGDRGGGGWKGAWRASLWARLLDGERAYRYIYPARTPNLFNGQIDANFGVPAGVCEMLMQSHLRSINNEAKSIEKAAFNGYVKDEKTPNHFTYLIPDERLAQAPFIIHLLPALPDAWPNGSITGLRARGGFEVDIEWQKGKLHNATIHAVKGGEFRIFSNGSLSKVISLKEGESMVWKD